MELSGTRSLVTGASGGLGQAIVRELARNGSSVVVTGRRVDVLEPLAAEVRGAAVACDLSDSTAVDSLVGELGDIDILVANAGLPGAGSIDDITADDVERTLAVNLRAPIVTAIAFGRAMARRGRGHIVMVSSLSGLTASPRSSLYSATKFGLRGFSLSLRQDLHDRGVGVSVILPGFIRDAGMFANADVTLPSGTRTKSPEDVARAVVRSIRHDKGEVLVAPFELRIGSKLGSVAPGIAAAFQRMPAAQRTSEAMHRAQRSVR